MKILTLEYMSSDESGSESGSGSEMMIRRKVFISRPLAWRTPEANSVMDSLDRKISRRRSERAKEMCRCRRTGMPSTRPSPENPSWAVIEN